MEEENKNRDPFDGEYIGNIWGWRISLIGLALIVVLGGIMIYRHQTLDVPFGTETQKEEGSEMTADSTRGNWQ
ncbi:MAG: hypothetical protein R3350_03980 [Saprospiraceae bacterium]|nr:hypothetical protein [Saprospiraceae bacterium]